MPINKRKFLFFLAFCLIVIAIALQFRPAVSKPPSNNNTLATIDVKQPVDDMAVYVPAVRSWLAAAKEDYSLQNIQAIKEKILNYRIRNSQLGSAHIGLYLSFVSWEKFLQTGQANDRRDVLDKLSQVAKLAPDLSADIDNLTKVIK